jgi:hypothetical protein
MRTEEEWKWGAENFRLVADHAPELTLAIEVMNRFESHLSTSRQTRLTSSTTAVCRM